MRTLLVLLLTVPLGLGADAPKAKGDAKGEAKGDAIVRQASSLEWKPAGDALPGAKMAVVAGDPSKEGAFTVRLAFPDGYRVQPHTHPGVEHVTVLSGTFHAGRGDTFDASRAQALREGDFFAMDAGVPHYGWAEGETVIQVTARGPWDLTYVGKGS